MTSPRTHPGDASVGGNASPSVGARVRGVTGQVVGRSKPIIAGGRAIAGIQRIADEFRVVVILAPQRDGAASQPIAEIRAALTTKLVDQVAELLIKQRVRKVIRIAPAHSTICRTTAVPTLAGDPVDTDPSTAMSSADREALVRALELVGEGELPAGVPPARRAAGILSPGPERANPIGVLIAWPNSSATNRAELEPLSGADESWTAELAALGGLAQALGGVRAVAFTSRGESHATCSAIARGRRSIARSARVASTDAATDELCADGARRVLDDARALAGSASADPGAPEVEPWSGRSLYLDSETPPVPVIAAMARSLNVTIDRSWLDRYGLALGAAFLAADPDPAVRSLATLAPGFEAERGTLADRGARWLMSPRNATAIIAACMVLALGVPWLSAWFRVRTLADRAAMVPDLEQRVAAGEQTAAFNTLLREQRWPMTKLLADISGAAPEGLQVESLELAHGEGVLLRGVAEEPDLVTAFRENLSTTRVFTEVATPSIGSSDEGVEFQLQAKLSGPSSLYSSPPKDDFAARPLADRLYGEGSAALLASDPPSTSSAARSGERSPLATDSASDRGGTPASPSRAGAARPSTTAAAPTIPPPITDAEIAALDRSKAMQEFTSRKRASAQAGIDEATKRRLIEEATKAQARMREADAQPSAAGGGR